METAWEKLMMVKEGKGDFTTETKTNIATLAYQELLEESNLASELKGQASMLKSGGTGLLVAGAVWLVLGKLGDIVANNVMNKYDVD